MKSWYQRIVFMVILGLSMQVTMQPSPQATMGNNVTSESTIDEDSWTLLPRWEGIAFCLVYLVESVNIIVGNIFAVAVFTSHRRMRKRKYYLLINLAVTDFLVGAVVVPWWTYDLALYFDLWIWRGNQFESAVAAESLDLLTKYASLIGLMVVSLERVYATLWPFKHRSVEERTYYILIGVIWALSILMPSVRVADIYELTSEDTFLFTALSFTSFILLVIFASYIVIWVKIRFGRPTPQHSKVAVNNRKLTASLFLVTVLSLVTWLPASVIYAVFRLLEMNGSTAWSYNSYSHAYYSAMMLVFANSLVNPIIYSFRLPHFKKAALRFVCRDPMETREGRNRSFPGHSSTTIRGTSVV